MNKSQSKTLPLVAPERVRIGIDAIVALVGVMVAVAGFFSPEVTWALMGV